VHPWVKLNFLTENKCLKSYHSCRDISFPCSAPVWRDGQVAALVDDPRRLVHLERLAGVLLADAVAVGALVLVEDVRRELAALVLPHFQVVVLAAAGVVRGEVVAKVAPFQNLVLLSNFVNADC